MMKSYVFKRSNFVFVFLSILIVSFFNNLILAQEQVRILPKEVLYNQDSTFIVFFASPLKVPTNVLLNNEPVKVKIIHPRIISVSVKKIKPGENILQISTEAGIFSNTIIGREPGIINSNEIVKHYATLLAQVVNSFIYLELTIDTDRRKPLFEPNNISLAGQTLAFLLKSSKKLKELSIKSIKDISKQFEYELEYLNLPESVEDELEQQFQHNENRAISLIKKQAENFDKFMHQGHYWTLFFANRDYHFIEPTFPGAVNFVILFSHLQVHRIGGTFVNIMKNYIILEIPTETIPISIPIYAVKFPSFDDVWKPEAKILWPK